MSFINEKNYDLFLSEIIPFAAQALCDGKFRSFVRNLVYCSCLDVSLIIDEAFQFPLGANSEQRLLLDADSIIEQIKQCYLLTEYHEDETDYPCCNPHCSPRFCTNMTEVERQSTDREIEATRHRVNELARNYLFRLLDLIKNDVYARYYISTASSLPSEFMNDYESTLALLVQTNNVDQAKSSLMVWRDAIPDKTLTNMILYLQYDYVMHLKNSLINHKKTG